MNDNFFISKKYVIYYINKTLECFWPCLINIVYDRYVDIRFFNRTDIYIHRIQYLLDLSLYWTSYEYNNIIKSRKSFHFKWLAKFRQRFLYVP